MVCQACQERGVSGGQFCSGCGAAFGAQPLGGAAYAMPRLFRARQGKVIAGVCAGIAARWGWDPVLVRLAAVALVLCGFGSPVLAYLAAWIVVPKTPIAVGYVPPAPPMGPAEAVVS